MFFVIFVEGFVFDGRSLDPVATARGTDTGDPVAIARGTDTGDPVAAVPGTDTS